MNVRENFSHWHESEVEPCLVGSKPDFQHLHVSLKKYGPINLLEDRPHNTVTPGTLTASSSTICGFLTVPLSLNLASPGLKNFTLLSID